MGDASTCYKCGKSGHWARVCHSKKREVPNFVAEKQDSIKNKVTRCFICRKLGHLARECPSSDGKYYDIDRPMDVNRRNDEAPPPPNFSMDNNPYGDLDGTVLTQAFESIEEHDWEYLKNEHLKDSPGDSKHHMGSEQKLGSLGHQEQSKYYKVVFLSNMKFQGYLDTCSEKCLIKYSAAKKAHLNVQLDDTDVMVCSPTFKGKIVSIGKAVTTVTVDAVDVANIEMFVVSDDVLNIDVVIGRSWLDNPQIIFLKLDNTVYVANITVHPFDKFRSFLSSLDIKPPGRKSVFDTRLDVVSSSDDEKSGKPGKLSKKRQHSRSKPDYKEIEEPVIRKPRDLSYDRERGREIVRPRSRSREHVREPPARNDRMGRLPERPRRSRERSRDRYMGRHSGRR